MPENITAKKDLRPDWLKDAHGAGCDCIACYEYKPDLHRPCYLGNGTYICPDCLGEYRTYKACLKHMGKVSNIMGTCKGGL